VLKTSLAEDRRAPAGDVGLSSQNFSFRMMEMQPTHKTKAGEVRIVDSNVFQASNAIAAAHIIVQSRKLSISTDVLGKPHDRMEGRLKVTGRLRYSGDQPIENVAYGYLVTSTID
jgi:hypothetical protein